MFLVIYILNGNVIDSFYPDLEGHVVRSNELTKALKCPVEARHRRKAESPKRWVADGKMHF